VPTSSIEYRLLGGSGAAEYEDDYLTLFREACDGDDGVAARQFRMWRRQPGFALAVARHGGYLVGCAGGMPLRPSTSWWRDLTAPLDPAFIAEHPGRTFALTELLVRASWRRQGIGRELHDRILAGREEERATVTVPPGATAAQSAFRAWGWRKVGRTAGQGRQSPVRDILVRFLLSGARGRGLQGRERRSL
jgi:GNAT superfamily N-acetyltransferase